MYLTGTPDVFGISSGRLLLEAGDPANETRVAVLERTARLGSIAREAQRPAWASLLRRGVLAVTGAPYAERLATRRPAPNSGATPPAVAS